LIVKVRIIGIVENEQPGLINTGEHLSCFCKCLDRDIELFGNIKEAPFSYGGGTNINPEYTPKAGKY